MQSLQKFRQQETLWDILLISPQFLLFIIFTILPFIISFPIVFTDKLHFLDASPDWVGFDNFLSIFRYPLSEEFFPALKRTALFFLGNYAMIFIIGLPLALFMFEFEKKYQKMKKFFYTIIFLPWMISGVGIGLLIVLLFSQDTGSYNLLLLKLGLISKPFNVQAPETSKFLMPILIGWRAAGFNMALFLSGLLSLPRDTLDAADVDGCTYLQKLWHVYLPQMIPNLIMVTIFCVMGSFAIFDVCVGLGGLRGNPAARFLSIIIYQLGFTASSGASGAGSRIGTMAQGIAVQLTIFVPLMIVAILLNRIQKKYQY